jgi:RNA polymerase sigma-70 factor (ECF subfamily)
MTTTDPTRWLDDHGDLLFGYALRRVRRREVAEDLVQETLLAAFRQIGSFDGRGEPGTWLVGILRHKIVDHVRREAIRRAEPLDDGDVERCEWGFAADGSWAAMPTDWAADPARRADAAELRRAIDDCRAKLPPPLAAAYAARDVEQLTVEQACDLLDVSPNHLAVRLYRARMAMRGCVEKYLTGGRPRP